MPLSGFDKLKGNKGLDCRRMEIAYKVTALELAAFISVKTHSDENSVNVSRTALGRLNVLRELCRGIASVKTRRRALG